METPAKMELKAIIKQAIIDGNRYFWNEANQHRSSNFDEFADPYLDELLKKYTVVYCSLENNHLSHEDILFIHSSGQSDIKDEAIRIIKKLVNCLRKSDQLSPALHNAYFEAKEFLHNLK